MPSKKVSKKSKTTTAVVQAAPAAPEAVVEEVQTPTMQDQFQVLLAQLSSLRSQLTSVTSQVRALSKRADRELKQAQKASRKKRKSGNRAPSGFVKPTKISLELSTFLGKPKGSEMARTEVTREINAYIRKHDLQDPKNRRFILLEGSDAAARLKTLLRDPDQPVTFFNIQRYLKPHYPMSEKEKKALEASDDTATTKQVPTPVVLPTTPEVVPDADSVEDAPKAPTKPPAKKRVVRNPKTAQ